MPGQSREGRRNEEVCSFRRAAYRRRPPPPPPWPKDARGAIFIVFIIVGRFAVMVCGAGPLILANLVGLLSMGVLAGLANLANLVG